MFYDSPRYSSGYAALFNTLSFMPETHMLKPYKQRVTATYQLMVSFIEAAAENANALIKQKRDADNAEITQKKFPLKWISDSIKYREITFKGYERDSAKSEATGLQKMFYNHDKPFTKNIKYYDVYKENNVVEKPLAYIIPQGWYEVVDRLKVNGVKVNRLKNDSVISVSEYHIASYKSYPSAYEKHHKNFNVKVNANKKNEIFLKGDYIIYLNQPVNRYIIEMLEPTGDDSFFAWNFFDGILQQKEGYSDYRWEDIAAGILKSDTTLQQKLQAKKTLDVNFANNSNEILNFIYKNSVYFESAYLKYPVYRVEN
jgi:hypothetical protein